jgi:hypothetical protein
MLVVAMMVGVVVAVGFPASQADTLRIVGFNVESGGADPAVIDDIVARLQDIDLWGFSEVQDAT